MAIKTFNGRTVAELKTLSTTLESHPALAAYSGKLTALHTKLNTGADEEYWRVQLEDAIENAVRSLK